MNECPVCFEPLETATASKGSLVAMFCPACNATWDFVPSTGTDHPPPLSREANLARLQTLRAQLAGQET